MRLLIVVMVILGGGIGWLWWSQQRGTALPAWQGYAEADYVKAAPVEQGMLNVAEALALAWRGVDEKLTSNAKLTILLENTVGAGAQLGGKFDELAAIRHLAGPYRHCARAAECVGAHRQRDRFRPLHGGQ